MILSKTIPIYNTEINEAAGISPEEFMERVKGVEMIRTRPHLKFTFYPSDINEIRRNRNVWEFVNGNFNSINTDSFFFFQAEFPEWMYLFLRYSTWENIEKCLYAGLTVLYLTDPSGRSILEKQIDDIIISKIRDLSKSFFPEYQNNVYYPIEDPVLSDQLNSDYWDRQNELLVKLDYFYRDYICNPIIVPFIYPPWRFKFTEDSLFNSKHFDIEFEASYFTDRDWDSIIVRMESDGLDRTESKEEPWKKWKSHFYDRHFCT